MRVQVEAALEPVRLARAVVAAPRERRAQARGGQLGEEGEALLQRGLGRLEVELRVAKELGAAAVVGGRQLEALFVFVQLGDGLEGLQGVVDAAAVFGQLRLFGVRLHRAVDVAHLELQVGDGEQRLHQVTGAARLAVEVGERLVQRERIRRGARGVLEDLRRQLHVGELGARAARQVEQRARHPLGSGELADLLERQLDGRARVALGDDGRQPLDRAGVPRAVLEHALQRALGRGHVLRRLGQVGEPHPQRLGAVRVVFERGALGERALQRERLVQRALQVEQLGEQLQVAPPRRDARVRAAGELERERGLAGLEGVPGALAQELRRGLLRQGVHRLLHPLGGVRQLAALGEQAHHGAADLDVAAVELRGALQGRLRRQRLLELLKVEPAQLGEQRRRLVLGRARGFGGEHLGEAFPVAQPLQGALEAAGGLGVARGEREGRFVARRRLREAFAVLEQLGAPQVRLHAALGRALRGGFGERVGGLGEVAAGERRLGEAEEGLAARLGLQRQPRQGAVAVLGGRVRGRRGERARQLEHAAGELRRPSRLLLERLRQRGQLAQGVARVAGHLRGLAQERRAVRRERGGVEQVDLRFVPAARALVELGARLEQLHPRLALAVDEQARQQRQPLGGVGAFIVGQEPEQLLRRPQVGRLLREQRAQRLGGGGGAAQLERQLGELAPRGHRLGAFELRPERAEQRQERFVGVRPAVQLRQRLERLQVVRPLLAVGRVVPAGGVEQPRLERGGAGAAGQLDELRAVRQRGRGGAAVERGLDVGERGLGVLLERELGAAQARGHEAGLFLQRLGEERLLAGRPARQLGGAVEQPGRVDQVVGELGALGEQLGGGERVARLELELGERLERARGDGPPRRDVERQGEALPRAGHVAAFEQRVGGLGEERRRFVGALGGDERLRAARPQLDELAAEPRVRVQRLEPREQLVVEPPHREGEPVVLARGFLVSQLLAGAAQLGARLGDALGRGVLGQAREQVLQGAARGLRPLAAHREVGQLEQRLRLGEQPRRLLQRDQRLAHAAQAGLEHLAQLAQGGGGEPLVAHRLGGAGALLEGDGQARHVAALALQPAQLAQGRQVVRLDAQHLGERVDGQVEVERQVARGDREAPVVAHPVLRVGGQLGQGLQAAAQLRAVAPALGDREHALERDAVVGVGVERGGEEPFGLVGLAEPAAVELSGLGPVGGARGRVLRDLGGLLAGVGQLAHLARGPEVREQLGDGRQVGRVEREGGLEVLAGARRVGELGLVQRRERVVRVARGGADRVGARGGSRKLDGLLVARDRLLQLAELLGDAGGVEERLGVAGQQGDRLAVAQQRVLALLEARLPDLAREQARPADAVHLVAAEGDFAEAVERFDRAQVLSAAAAQVGQLVERVGVIRLEAQRRLAVEAGAGDVVFGLRAQRGHAHVGVGGVDRVAGERGDAAVGAHRAGAVLRLIRRARQGLERRQVIRPEAEQLVQRLDRHLRGLVPRGARGGLGGEEGGGLLLLLARQVAQRQVALGGAGALAAALAHHGLGPQRGGAPVPPAGERLRHVERQVVRLRIRHQQGEQPLDREGVRLVRVPVAQVQLARLGELALGDELFGVGEGARALQRQEELLVGHRGRRQPAGREAQLEPLGADLGRRQARLVEHRHLVAAAHRGRLGQRRQHAGGEARRAPQLELGEELERFDRARQDDGHLRRGGDREAVEADVVDVDREPVGVAVERELEGERRPFGLTQPGLAFEVAGAEMQLELIELGELSGDLRDLPRDQLGVDQKLEVAEVQLLLLVPRRAAGDVERERDVGDLQREVRDGQPGREGHRGEADERASVEQPELGTCSLALLEFVALDGHLASAVAASEKPPLQKRREGGVETSTHTGGRNFEAGEKAAPRLPSPSNGPLRAWPACRRRFSLVPTLWFTLKGAPPQRRVSLLELREEASALELWVDGVRLHRQAPADGVAATLPDGRTLELRRDATGWAGVLDGAALFPHGAKPSREVERAALWLYGAAAVLAALSAAAWATGAPYLTERLAMGPRSLAVAGLLGFFGFLTQRRSLWGPLLGACLLGVEVLWAAQHAVLTMGGISLVPVITRLFLIIPLLEGFFALRGLRNGEVAGG